MLLLCTQELQSAFLEHSSCRRPISQEVSLSFGAIIRLGQHRQQKEAKKIANKSFLGSGDRPSFSWTSSTGQTEQGRAMTATIREEISSGPTRAWAPRSVQHAIDPIHVQFLKFIGCFDSIQHKDYIVILRACSRPVLQ
jgi:hypothetical protein